jgi:hypothetical protein
VANNPKITIQKDETIKDEECRKRAKKGGDTVTWVSHAARDLIVRFPDASPFGATTSLKVPAGGSAVGTVDPSQPLGKYRYHLETTDGVETDDPDIILEL